MASILEFLQEVDSVLEDESIAQTPYSKTSALELRVCRDRLEKSFNEDPSGDDTRTLFAKANGVALGLEWHLSIVNEAYRSKNKHRTDAEILFKSMQSILTDYNMRKDEFDADEVALAEFAIMMNDTYKYYRKSLNFVWNRTVHDDILVEKIKGFMEDYNNGLYFRRGAGFRTIVCDNAEVGEHTAGVDDCDTGCSSNEVIEEQMAETVNGDDVSGDSSVGVDDTV